MRPGKLRHFVTINRYAPTVSPVTGETIAAYKELDTGFWAEIRPLSAKEMVNAQQTVGESTHRITMRYTPYVGRKDQIIFGSRVFEIESVLNRDERNIELTLMAHEIT